MLPSSVRVEGSNWDWSKLGRSKIAAPPSLEEPNLLLMARLRDDEDLRFRIFVVAFEFTIPWNWKLELRSEERGRRGRANDVLLAPITKAIFAIEVGRS